MIYYTYIHMNVQTQKHTHTYTVYVCVSVRPHTNSIRVRWGPLCLKLPGGKKQPAWSWPEVTLSISLYGRASIVCSGCKTSHFRWDTSTHQLSKWYVFTPIRPPTPRPPARPTRLGTLNLEKPRRLQIRPEKSVLTRVISPPRFVSRPLQTQGGGQSRFPSQPSHSGRCRDILLLISVRVPGYDYLRLTAFDSFAIRLFQSISCTVFSCVSTLPGGSRQPSVRHSIMQSHTLSCRATI